VRSQLHDQGEVLEAVSGPDGMRLVVKAPRAILGKFSEFAAVDRSA